jgi:hypothetical protein
MRTNFTKVSNELGGGESCHARHLLLAQMAVDALMLAQQIYIISLLKGVGQKLPGFGLGRIYSSITTFYSSI